MISSLGNSNFISSGNSDLRLIFTFSLNKNEEYNRKFKLIGISSSAKMLIEEELKYILDSLSIYFLRK